MPPSRRATAVTGPRFDRVAVTPDAVIVPVRPEDGDGPADRARRCDRRGERVTDVSAPATVEVLVTVPATLTPGRQVRGDRADARDAAGERPERR
jgi:hypothetical protein